MTTRRDFIKKTVAGTAALSLGSILPGFGSSRYQDILGANEKIRIGVIGVNSRGSALAQGFAKQPDCEVTYICDVDSRALEKCQAAIHKLTGRTPKGEKDIRKMLESNEFEAVVIATPDHWHAKAAIMAMQAGKHVYLEKPTSHNPAENEMLVRATLKYNRIVQVGNQRRSFPNVIKAMEEIKSGTIGKVRYAKSWYVNNRPSIGIEQRLAAFGMQVHAHLGVAAGVAGFVERLRHRLERAVHPVKARRHHVAHAAVRVRQRVVVHERVAFRVRLDADAHALVRRGHAVELRLDFAGVDELFQ